MRKRIFSLGVVAALAVPLATLSAVHTAVSASPTMSLQQLAQKEMALRGDPLRRKTSPAPKSQARAGLSAGYIYSSNWAGYADVNHPYSNVNSTFRVPKVTCNKNSYAGFWVGIDGFSNGSVEQDGVAAYCAKSGSAPVYTAWWEMYPQNYMQNAFYVKAGDLITAGVKYMGSNRYWLQVIDKTNGKKFSVYSYKSGGYSNRSSAEWITEAPSGASGQYNLAKFANIEFAGDTAVSGLTHYARTWPHYAIVSRPWNETSNPSGFNSAGSAFTEYWKNYF